MKFEKLHKQNTPIDDLLDIANELTDWEYKFVMSIAESGYTSTKQSINIFAEWFFN